MTSSVNATKCAGYCGFGLVGNFIFLLYNDGIICFKWVNLGLMQEEDLCFSRVNRVVMLQSSRYEVL